MITIEVTPVSFEKWKAKLQDYSDKIMLVEHGGSRRITIYVIEIAWEFRDLIRESKIIEDTLALDGAERAASQSIEKIKQLREVLRRPEDAPAT